MPRSSPTASPSDEELARRAQQGSTASFEELLRRFQTPVLQFLQHRGAAAAAEDLLQETFIRAYVNLFRYRSRWRFATWLFTIARRVSLNHHRRRRPISGAAVESAECGAVGPAEAAAAADSRQYLWDRAAQVLSQEELTALWLHYVESMSTRDIATVLERSGVAVKTMIFRARRKLAPVLKELAPEGTVPGSRAAPARNNAWCA
jgi:RNA polymerase sigma-70 factor (ECF subfamily)